MENIVNKFDIQDKIIKIKPFGNGHINGTYVIICKNNSYLLQEINKNVFNNINMLMNNIFLVTNHLKEKIAKRNGNCLRETLTIIKTTDNELFYYDKINDKYYRMYIYIDNTVAYENNASLNIYKEVSSAFSQFYSDLNDFDASKLYIVIQNFHNTQKRYENLINSIKNDKFNRVKDCVDEINYLKSKENYYNRINLLLENKKVLLRVTHNDTKLNNVLFDKKTNKPLCVIDLDTIMPGSILFDFGDAIRFICNTSKEDEIDLNKVCFSLDNFKAYSEGFLLNLKSILTKDEIDNLAFSANLITLEQAIRFLDDYLNGDSYYKTEYKNHNLIRAKNQIKLASEIEKNIVTMNDVIKELIK